MKKKDSAGFTLIEMMIVVEIIAIMVAIAVPSLRRQKIQTNEAAAVGNLKVVIGRADQLLRLEEHLRRFRGPDVRGTREGDGLSRSFVDEQRPCPFRLPVLDEGRYYGHVSRECGAYQSGHHGHQYVVRQRGRRHLVGSALLSVAGYRPLCDRGHVRNFLCRRGGLGILAGSRAFRDFVFGNPAWARCPSYEIPRPVPRET